MNFVDKIALIHIEDKKILMTLSKGLSTWYIPGGKREGDESNEAALIREIKEELSVDLLPGTITHYGTFAAAAHNKPEGVMVRMTCYTAEFSGTVTPDNEIEKIAYLSYADKLKTSAVDHLIFDDLHKRGLLD